MKSGILFALTVCALAIEVNAQSDSLSRSWNQPVAPFRIIDNIYYVGAPGVTSFLIVTLPTRHPPPAAR
jgi:metallo-beta-lactamase class B